jgi:hypothetical protein
LRRLPFPQRGRWRALAIDHAGAAGRGASLALALPPRRRADVFTALDASGGATLCIDEAEDAP